MSLAVLVDGSFFVKRFRACYPDISGDSDFIPTAKLARREGIDFILDPMWNHVDPMLLEHIDGLKSFSKKPPHMQ